MAILNAATWNFDRMALARKVFDHRRVQSLEIQTVRYVDCVVMPAMAVKDHKLERVVQI